jgi:hypothetical protein
VKEGRHSARLEFQRGRVMDLRMTRTFPRPWTFEENNNACFIVRDANKFPVAYVYFEDEPGRRASANLMTKDGA